MLHDSLKVRIFFRGDFGMASTAKFIRDYLPPKDHLAAIGAVAVVWTALESSMEITLLGLYEIDLGRGLVISANLSFHARLSLLRILTGEKVHMTGEQAKEMSEILSRLDTGYGDRNTVVHGLWTKTGKPGIIERMSIRARGKKLQTLRQDYSAADIWAVADRLAVLLSEFVALGDRLGLKERLAMVPKHSGAL